MFHGASRVWRGYVDEEGAWARFDGGGGARVLNGRKKKSAGEKANLAYEGEFVFNGGGH